jgi:esterase/lipase superfamily enzyme
VPRESIWNFEFRPDPNKHLVLESVTPYSGEGAFLSNLKTQIGATKRKEALVYIHGFANSFEDAAIHTAQLATDLELDGAPVLYSWPSSGSVISYDRALWLSQQIQGYPRAGDASAPVVLAGLDTVDTTKASGGLIGHDDFSGSALNDFQSVIWLSLLPKDRCLLAPQKFGANMTYWSFTTDKCAEPVFMAAITMLRRIGQSETVKLLKNQIELATKAGMQTDAARWKDVLALVQVIQP